MRNDRFIEYVGSERDFVVRWLKPGCSDKDCQEVDVFAGQPAGFKKFAKEVDAARLYNQILVERPRWRVELYSSQIRWLCTYANRDDCGEPRNVPIGMTRQCRQGSHSSCAEPAECACKCHLPLGANTP